ncbi:hypothetical protein GOBAR_AA04380 [Gossypium barbadense]|uniref:RING-type E3 ubiquitin transferase n=1 Tax=Gossypium barbadense TaxID=3634 RepID=A0A2P5YKR4_GOSBA|nr:hypothetical protein GOBAR_AA04380 [Gossypium barbadense]
MLTWNEPNCLRCENGAGNCMFKSETGLDVGCSVGFTNGLSRHAKYGIMFGAGIPVLFIVGLVIYLRNKVEEDYNNRHPNQPELLSTTPRLDASVKGLDGQTIEAYPVTLLSESRRLPRPNDNTCPICLSEYQAKEMETTQDVTILTFPYAGHFSVFHIDYAQQVLQLGYSVGCLPRILLQGLNLSGSPFMSVNTQSYTFYNCSTMVQYPGVLKIPCLSGFNFYVVAIPTDGYTPSTSVCLEIAKVMVPMSTDWWEDGMTLGWNQPDCRWCESHQGTCLFENVGAGLQVGCDSAIKHLPSSVRDALVFGLGISLMCLIAVISCVKLNFTEGQNHPNPEILMTHPRSTPGSTKGLDRQTIDTYPTTLLGPSRCLPNPRDNIYSICLCEYQANETLRTIPNCSHYFHVDCIDQWLKLNATCPECRDKFEEPSPVAPTLSSLMPVVAFFTLIYVL